VGYLERLGLPREFLDKSFHDLSIGERQRVCIVRALMTEPLFLLLDEPTSALDSENAETLYQELKALPHNPGLVIVSHDKAWEASFTDSILVELTKP
jgi:ABC-type lipoprotein export system ATPase subunit